MNESRIATKLLTLLASGGTVGRVMTELPAFKTQIEAALDWMKTTAGCTSSEIEQRAHRLGQLMQEKEQAIKNRDVDLAASIRDKECALAKSLGLRAKGQGWNPVLDVEYQMKCLSEVLSAWVAALDKERAAGAHTKC
jgi:hypothetical protein